MTDPSSRMLQLLSLLQTHRYWPGTELARRLDVSPRTLRRDVDRLRELGYPVDAQRGLAGGYQLQAGAAMPPLLLDDEEAVAIAVGLRSAAGGAIVGIVCLLLGVGGLVAVGCSSRSTRKLRQSWRVRSNARRYQRRPIGTSRIGSTVRVLRSPCRAT